MKSHRNNHMIVKCSIALCLFFVIVLSGCQNANYRTIINLKLDHYQNKENEKHINLYPPEYRYLIVPPQLGYMEKTEYDNIDFRKPHEKGVRSYSILHDPKGDIDRTKGYIPEEYTVPPDLALINNPAHDIQITWINHAAFLIQFDDKYQILTDPVLEHFDGFVCILAKFIDTYKPQAEPPLKVNDIPFKSKSEAGHNNNVNIVTISHDHYDHLNFNTIKQLPKNTQFYIPLGVENEFPSGFPYVTAMDWYTEDRIANMKITFLPANHSSGRGLKSNTSLWGGWLFEYNNTRIYFSGDSGYSDLFKGIGKHYGKIDICLMPISSYFQRDAHFAPEDAIQAAQDCGCKILIPWGWGTYIMGYEHILEPPRRLQYAWDQMKPENMELHILKMGETFSLDFPINPNNSESGLN